MPVLVAAFSGSGITEMPEAVDFDVLIVGAGAAGLMCAIESAKRGRRTCIIEHTAKIAEKIRISGGGRCNFTNLHCSPDHYISQNPHFCRSALSRYSQHDFIKLIESHGISYHEKTLGQLFCDHSADDIIQMLRKECSNNDVTIRTSTAIDKINHIDEAFTVSTSSGTYICQSVVIACGGLSIPKIGASPFGYKIAEQFGHSIIPVRAGLVPLTFQPALLAQTKDLSGLAIEKSRISSANGKLFDEAMLFTHKGLSGPAILQISSYWHEGEEIHVNMLPHEYLPAWIKGKKKTHGQTMVHTLLGEILPKRLCQKICEELNIQGRVADINNQDIDRLCARLQNWAVKPAGSEGYRTAEVTLGGVDTDEVSSKTFESRKQKGLYFIGEVLDVTGHLGGFNFQWAWSSGWCAGQYV